MQIIRTVVEMQRLAREAGRSGSMGLVPTMGALHEGHLSLVRRARAENAAVVASIFVNPLQFGKDEDLDKYPRTFESDCEKLKAEGVDFLFAPTPEEMYRSRNGMGVNTEARTLVDPGPIATRLDGAARPGHFLGVATVVAKLLHIVTPNRAYFGQKDAAQLAVIRAMVLDLNIAVAVVACSIVRDDKGLALSSRNRYLSVEERGEALILSRTLAALRTRIQDGSRDSERLSRDLEPLRYAGPIFRLEYLAFVDPETLLPVQEAIPGTLIAIAAKVGMTRLIDNFLAP